MSFVFADITRYARAMEWLNYHHLLYFWTVVRTGGVANAARELRLAQPTVSGQLRLLEEHLGEKLLERAGRRVVPTDVGRLVFRYADEIFSLGRELQDALKGRPTGRPARLQVGIVDAMPKMVVKKILEPALSLPEPVHLVCQEDKAEVLLAELAIFHLDLVLADAPVPPGAKVKAYSHLLGDTAVTWFGTPKLAAGARRDFPRSLDGAPVLVPTEGTELRRALDRWFDAVGVRPRLVAEVADSALLKVFGEAGVGLFCAPSVVEDDIRTKYGVSVIGRVEEVRERFYAISVERRLKNPAVVAISTQARAELGGGPLTSRASGGPARRTSR
jgi:LysR family transcriptional activator of nhaA